MSDPEATDIANEIAKSLDGHDQGGLPFGINYVHDAAKRHGIVIAYVEDGQFVLAGAMENRRAARAGSLFMLTGLGYCIDVSHMDAGLLAEERGRWLRTALVEASDILGMWDVTARNIPSHKFAVVDGDGKQVGRGCVFALADMEE